jgi:hypothetical protein
VSRIGKKTFYLQFFMTQGYQKTIFKYLKNEKKTENSFGIYTTDFEVSTDNPKKITGTPKLSIKSLKNYVSYIKSENEVKMRGKTT